MAEVADQTQHEFWRAPLPASKAVATGRATNEAQPAVAELSSSSAPIYCHVVAPAVPIRALALPAPSESLVWLNSPGLVSGSGSRRLPPSLFWLASSAGWERWL